MKVIAICDDDIGQLKRAQRTIERYARRAGHDVQFQQFTSVDQCIDGIAFVDVVFMDIEFGDVQLGIKAASTINELKPGCQVVYLTNYLQYSLDVYATNHAWFVLKDQLEARLPEVFHKLAELDAARNAQIAVYPTDGDGLLSLRCSEIAYLERNNRTTTIRLQDGREVLVRDRIPDLLEKMPESGFARCHSSFAVNLARVREIGPTELALDTGARVPVSRRFYKPFRTRYLAWLEGATV